MSARFQVSLKYRMFETSTTDTPLVGNTPRHFALDPSGAFLLVAAEDSDAIDVYSVHPRSGQLRPVRASGRIEKPTCVVMVPVK